MNPILLRASLMLGVAAALSACGPAPTPQKAAAPAPNQPAANPVQPIAKTFTLTGEVPGAQDGARVEVFLDPIDLKALKLDVDARLGPTATTQVKAGRFSVTMDVEQPVHGSINVGGMDSGEFVAEPGETIRMVQGGNGALVARGGKINERMWAYALTPAYLNAGEALEAAQRSGKASEATLERLAGVSDRIRLDYQAGILDNPAEPALLRLFTLSNNMDRRYSEAKRLDMIAGLERELPGNPVLAEYKRLIQENVKRLDNENSIKVGSKIRDLNLTDLTGKPLMLSSIVGKDRLLLLDLWASWCESCRDEFPAVVKLQDEFKSQGFKVFAVSIDDSRKDWLKAVKEVNVPFMHALADGGSSGQVLEKYGATAVPLNFLLRADGTIIAKNVHGDALRQEVRKALSQPR